MTIDPNYRPRGYDLPMEIACCIPPFHPVLLKELAEDFGFRGQLPLGEPTRTLIGRGFGLTVHNVPGGRGLLWKTATDALDGMTRCLAYWNAVYPQTEADDD